MEPLDRVVPFGQVPHIILSSHEGCRLFDLRIPRMLVTEGVDEVDNTPGMDPNPQCIQILTANNK